MNSTQLRGFLTGLILGDGTIDKGTTKRAFRIKSINFDFIDYIEYTLKNITNFKVKTKEIVPKDRKDANRQPYKELTIQSHPYFSKLYHEFYDDYRNRRITNRALNWLNIEGLSNRYMSDGYIVRVGITKGNVTDRRVEIATDKYTESDVQKVANYITNKLGYECWPYHRNKDMYRIRFSLLSAQNMLYDIKDYVVPSMEYKLDMYYNYRPKWMCEEYYLLMQRLESARTLTDNAEG